MWISLNWIKRLAQFDNVNINDLVNKITLSIAEVEGYEEKNPHLKSIYSAKILDIEKIPETSHLQKCKIDTGEETLQVVCGANNIKEGDIVPLAKVGSVLPLEDGKTLKIKKGKLKGVESFGMLCSAKELGLSSDHSGIMKLESNTKLNTKLSDILKGDTLIEIDNKSITHRPDLWGHLGFAREIAALFSGSLNKDYYSKDFDTCYNKRKKEIDLKISIEDSKKCRRYSCLAIKNVEVKDSPAWMQEYLISVGLKPINNIVDITNFVMLELGQPMHAFDFNKLESGNIFIRNAKKGEKISALDENNYELNDAQLLIADKSNAIAIAGVMGGNDSKIDENTTNIVFESANFHASTIRIGANKLSLRTDSSNRFEKSLDPENTISAIKLAYYLLKETNKDAYIASDLIDDYPNKAEKIYIKTNYDNIRKKLGLTINDIDDNYIKTNLEKLCFKLKENEKDIIFEVPSFRATKDISIEADLVEEIGRIYGYDNIKPKAIKTNMLPPIQDSQLLLEKEMKNLFVNKYDFSEIYNYSFVSHEDVKAFNENIEDYLALRNYLSSDYTLIRRHLYISALKAVKVNAKNKDYFSFFELERAYHKENKTKDNLAEEKRYLLLTTYVQNAKESGEKFLEFKAILNDYLKTLNLKGVMSKIPNNKKIFAHPHRALEYSRGRDKIAEIIEIDPRFLSRNSISGRVVCMEIDLIKLNNLKKSSKVFNELAKFPYSRFEVSVLADKKTFINDIILIARKAAGKLLKDIELLSIYEGDSISKDKKSVSLGIYLGDDNRTLKTKEIDKTLDNVILQLEKKGYPLKN